MVKVSKKARQKYLDFLKEKVQEYCNKDGCYEMYWDYRDSVSPNMILEAFEKYKDAGYTSIEDYLVNQILENNLDYDNYLFEQVRTDIYKTDDIDLINAYVETEDINVDMEEIGYNGVDCNIEDVLRNTRIKVNNMFATDNERNYDMGSIITSFGNSYQTPFVTWSIDDIDYLDNALTYFIHQQGHTVKEVYDCLLNNPRGFGSKEEMSFAKAIVNDVVNNPSEAMSELTALVELSGRDIITFFDAVSKEQQYLKFAENTDIGLFNEWSGTGGLLEFQLDKPFVVPTSMVRNIQIEDAGKENNGYTVDSVYGLVGDCWKDTLSITEEAPTLQQEDLSKTISDIEYFIAQKEKEEIDICDD